MPDPTTAIQEIIDRETRAWDARDLDLLIGVFHPDMVWPWPPTPQAHDPLEWVMPWGRFEADRWRAGWQELFDSHELIHNVRTTRKIVISAEGDGAFAVVDIDTLWRDRRGNDFHWLGRTCKIYSKVADGWKMISQVGALEYG
jgi:ketosteroid isomerase-like protein